MKTYVQFAWLCASQNHTWKTTCKSMNWNNETPANASAKACSFCFLHFKAIDLQINK